MNRIFLPKEDLLKFPPSILNIEIRKIFKSYCPADSPFPFLNGFLPLEIKIDIVGDPKVIIYLLMYSGRF